MNLKQIIIIFLLVYPSKFYSILSGFHLANRNKCDICHIFDEESKSEFSKPQWVNSWESTVYVTYSSSSIDALMGQPSNSSKMCLSCHDGTVATDDQGGKGMSQSSILGTNLSRNHPISFTYDIMLAYKDKGLHDPTSAASGLGSTISKDMLVNGKLECISCHDAHAMRGTKNLLLKSNYRSRLCLTCHDK